jgi:amino acid adenylation domain-containing protein
MSARSFVFLHQLFERQAQLSPHAVAVRGGRESLTYAALNDRAEHVARLLRIHDIGPDDLVGVIAPREPATITAILGVLKAGGAYVSIDTAYPADHIDYVITDARIRVVLARDPARLPFQSNNLSVLAIGDDRVQRHERPRDFAALAPENAALVVYTSGSTGRPKGVVIPHRAAVERTLAGFQYHPGDLQKFSFSVVAHLADVFRPLAGGGVIEFVADDALRDPLALSRTIRSHATTTSVFVPSHLQTLLESDTCVESLHTLDNIIVSGEAASQSFVETVKTRLPAARLLNSYGLSELSGLTCVGEVHSANEISVGRPLPGVAVHVLDEHMRPVPPGESGEVYLGGVQLARGYLYQPALTAERFVPDPCGDAGERLYRTGDMAFINRNGDLQLKGRCDHQVNVRGFRVNPSDIESVIMQHPAVDRVVVVAARQQESQRLVAFVQPRPTTEGANEPALREFVERKLPASMVPNRFEAIVEFPLLPNGKVDRRALAKRADSAEGRYESQAREGQSGQTATEDRIAAIWAEVFQVSAIDLSGDFFNLGGDSLSGMRILSRVNAAFDLEVSLQDLLDHPTPAALSLAIYERLGRVGGS